MTIQEILDYVMQTPGNTNRAVLKDMVEQVAAAGNNSGSGSENFVVTFTPVESTGEEINLVSDKTYAEVAAAYENQQIMGKISVYNMQTASVVSEENVFYFVFFLTVEDFIIRQGDSLQVIIIMLGNDNQIEVEFVELANVDNIAGSDENDSGPIVVTIEEDNVEVN